MIHPILYPFSEGYRAGIALRKAAYKYRLFKSRRLNRPVISVGNLTVGGTGKTPLVMYIAERLLDCGWTPSILTRGYRRTVRGMIVLAPQTGRRPDPRQVGDEVALLAAILPKIPIVVSGNRYRAGRMAEERYAVDVHLLDDGFQHWALERTADVVTIDVTQELKGRLLPAGRFREPRSALRRADIIVLTRTEQADGSAHKEIIARFNPRAEVFESRITLRDWVDAQTGSLVPRDKIHGHRALAFCGIGNPGAYFANLRKWGVKVVGEEPYRDHHRYGPGHLYRLERRAISAGAEFMVTTEKDLANFPPRWKLDIPVFVGVTRLEVNDAEGLEKSIIQRVRSLQIVG